MKNITKSLYSLLAVTAGVLATSCQLTEVSEFDTTNPNNKKEVTINANYGVDSKVAVNKYDNWSSTWETGDAIGAYTLGDTELSEFTIGNIADDAKSASFTGEAGDEARFVYPMSDKTITNGKYTIDLAGATMSGAEAMTAAGASEDLVLVSSKVVDIAGGESSIVMQHQTAFLKLAFTASTTGANSNKAIRINKVTIKGAGDFEGIPTSATLDLTLPSSDANYYTKNSASEYVLDMSKDGLNVYTPYMSFMPATVVDAVVAVLPFDLESGDGFEITLEAEVSSTSGVVSKYTYTQTKENTTGAALPFAKGTYNTISVNIPFEELVPEVVVAPITATISNITETSADCVIEYTGDRAFYVCSTDGTMTNWNEVMSQGPTVAYPSGGTNQLIDLDPATTYYLYTIVSVSGVHSLGEVVSFTTLGDVPAMIPTVSNITQTTADCVFEYEGTGMAMYLCTTDGSLTTSEAVITAGGVELAAASGEVTELTGLTPNTEYFIYPLLPDFTVQSTVYELGKVVSFKTKEEENLPASISVAVSGVTSSHADFTFTFENKNFAYFLCTTEKWDSYTSDDVKYTEGVQMIINTYQSGDLYSYFAELEKNTTYYVYTTACNMKGEWVVGERVEFTTLGEDPTYAITAAVSNVTHNTADCVFTYASQIGSYVVTTVAGLDIEDLKNEYASSKSMAAASGTTTTIQGLEPMTKYYLYPISVAADMTYTLGKVESFTTDPEPVAVVTTIGGSAINVTATSAAVVINYENTRAQYYLFSTDGSLSDVYDIMGNGSKVLFQEMSGSSVSFSNLTPGTDYYVYTAAIDLDGNQTMGNTITFTTLDE